MIAVHPVGYVQTTREYLDNIESKIPCNHVASGDGALLVSIEELNAGINDLIEANPELASSLYLVFAADAVNQLSGQVGDILFHL